MGSLQPSASSLTHDKASVGSSVSVVFGVALKVTLPLRRRQPGGQDPAADAAAVTFLCCHWLLTLSR